MMNNSEFDVIIVGSGIAGLHLANLLAPHARIALVSKRRFLMSNSYYAQGGIAAVLDKSDSFTSHINDTIIAGDSLNDAQAVKTLVHGAPAQIQQLIDWGVQFDRANHGLDLTREGGHSHRRIVHVRDLTGRAVEKTLLQRLQQFPNITYFEHHLGLDLIQSLNSRPFPLTPFPKGQEEKLSSPFRGPGGQGEICGITLLNHKTNILKNIYAPVIVLATGGCGQVYQYTTNPAVATGDGIAMAHRADAAIEHMEFMQFHPTVLNLPRRPHFLLSESLRGEGAVLRNSTGKRFMKKYDHRAELAPRDIVSRAVATELKNGGVYLDISHRPKTYLQNRFPYLYTQLLKYGLKLDKNQVPIAPAAHYLCGGIKTDLHGRTTLSQLYAVGEVACTGVHGANRLASNSLLECLVFAERVSLDIMSTVKLRRVKHETHSVNSKLRVVQKTPASVYLSRKKIRKIMWQSVGITRTHTGLINALYELDIIQKNLAHEKNQTINYYTQETVNLLEVAKITAQQALARKHSAGAHYVQT